MKTFDIAKKFLAENSVSMFLFGIVGISSAIIYFCVFGIFYDLLHVNYKIAVSIAYVASVILHFIANRSLTFKNRDGAFSAHLFKYLLVLLINYGITLMVVSFAVGSLLLSPYLGIVFSIVLTASSGYFMLKFWVFRVYVKEINNAY